jgi:hypothetical protein
MRGIGPHADEEEEDDEELRDLAERVAGFRRKKNLVGDRANGPRPDVLKRFDTF